MKISQNDEKKLVQNYKSTNRQLRKQLENLNREIDRVLEAKINRVGLKKLPNVDKHLERTQDVKLLQLQVDNQRKRVEQLIKDNQNLKVRITVDHMTLAKQLQDQLADKKKEKEALKKQVYLINKTSMTLNTTDLPLEQMKLYDKIEQVNQELLRAKKQQSDLQNFLGYKQEHSQKKASFIQQSQSKHQKAADQAQKIMKSRVEIPITYQSSADEEEWKRLKKQFLELKESKIWEENKMKEDNDRLRNDIRQLQLRLKQKKYTLQNIKSLEIRRKERNYSTLEPGGQKGSQNVRYRNRNNSYKYNTRN